MAKRLIIGLFGLLVICGCNMEMAAVKSCHGRANMYIDLPDGTSLQNQNWESLKVCEQMRSIHPRTPDGFRYRCACQRV
jgi:hypothetical protein